MHLVSEHTPFRAELSASFSKSFFFFQGRQWKDKPRSLCNNSKPLSKYMSHTSWAMSWEPGVSRNEEQLFCSVFLITQLQTSAKILLQREDWKQSKGLQIVIQGWIRGNDLRVKSLKVDLSKGKYSPRASTRDCLSQLSFRTEECFWFWSEERPIIGYSCQAD